MKSYADPGTYVLVIRMAAAVRIPVGALGLTQFQAGYYCYVGSAMNGLTARLRRHQSCEKRLHWHIDYVLQASQIVAIWYVSGQRRRECVWARALAAQGLQPCTAPLGASDCTCHTHLFYSPEQPSIDLLNRAVEPADRAQAMPIASEIRES